MMERMVGWAVRKTIEDADDSVATSAALGAALDGAAFKAIGFSATTAVAAGAIAGAIPKMMQKLKEDNGGEA